MILRLKNNNAVERQTAMSDICGIYWPALYALARGLQKEQHDAEDLVQGFISQLLERESLEVLEPERGRMRSFMRTSFKNYVRDQARRAEAQRRGGGAQLIALELEAVEADLLHHESPDVTYDRQWAQALVNSSLAKLRARYAARGRGELMQQLEPCLAGEQDSDYAALAAQLGQSETNLRATMYRLRREFREILRAEVAQTLGPDEDVDEELRELMRVAG